MNGIPSLPGTNVKCVEMIHPPVARIASAMGLIREGRAEMASQETPGSFARVLVLESARALFLDGGY